jgi:hypothetical protein
MKKKLITSTLLGMLVTLVACTKTTTTKTTTTTNSITTTITTTVPTTTTTQTKVDDKNAPVIIIDNKKLKISIKANEQIDLLDGVMGVDEEEGIITNKITTNTNGFDSSVPGVYEIYYFLKDSAGNQAEYKMKTITVLDTIIVSEYPVYTGEIENEAQLPAPSKCFGGAWYHKVVSSKDYWVGMEGTVTIPHYDIDRYQVGDKIETNPAKDVLFDQKNLDNPSIYMGGNAHTESDVGLSLSRVLLANGVSLSTGSVAFRPFWRYITSPSYADEGTYDATNGRNYAVSCTGSASKNCIASHHYSYTEYYYLPGDKLRIIIHSPEPNYLQLQIEVLEVSKDPYSINLRKEMKWKDPENFKSPKFRSNGHNTGMLAEYKRVNAIDQSGNEGKVAIETSTHVSTAIWHESYLYRKINGQMYRVPMTSRRVNVMNCPNPEAFIIDKTPEQDSVGGEKIEIKPAGISNTINITAVIKKKDEELF